MFGNYLATALRNLQRNWLYGAISILGLAVGFATAILVAAFVFNEFSYDHFIPEHQLVYRISEDIAQPGQPPAKSDVIQSTIARQAELAHPGIVAARVAQDYPGVRGRRGDEPTAEQNFFWADPDIFTVLPLPAVSGDPNTALAAPDTVVLTQRMARKYFGKEDVVGETLLVEKDNEQHALRVTAVLRDLPSNSHLITEIMASAKGAYTPLAKLDIDPGPGFATNNTYVRLPNAQAIADFKRGLEKAELPLEAAFASFGAKANVTLIPVPLTEIHLRPNGLGASNAKPSGNKSTIFALALVAFMVVLAAGINFITLMTARAARRGVEVGIRKAAGARRSDLIVQFMGETLIYVAISLVAALALAALLIKPFSIFLQRDLSLDLVQQPALLGVLALAVVVGLLAGVYPALILSGFRPAAVLKGGVIQTTGSALARQALVIVQFAILIGLILATTTIYRQTSYALSAGLGAETRTMVAMWDGCKFPAIVEEVRRLPGAQAAACASAPALNFPNALSPTPVRTADGRGINIKPSAVDFDFFEMLNIKPLAGRLFSRNHGGDGVLQQPGSTGQPTIVINETAVRALGFASPEAALGQTISWPLFLDPKVRPTPQPSEIVGVVKDMPTTVRAPVDPTFYFIGPPRRGMLAVKMSSQDMPATVKGIERAWKATGATQPIQMVFLDQARRSLYLDVITQGVIIAVCAVLAVLIACLGLFALSAFTTERRTKEIGVRKAMGASTSDVMGLFIWQFTQPVLWAIVIALPIGFLVMRGWLDAFVYRVDLPIWTFVAAAAAALVIAWATVSFHSFMVARSKPVSALRYE